MVCFKGSSAQVCVWVPVCLLGKCCSIALQLFLSRVSEIKLLESFSSALKKFHVFIVWKLLRVIFLQMVDLVTKKCTWHHCWDDPSPEFFPISSCLWLFISTLDYRILALNKVNSRVRAWDFDALVHEVFVFSQRAAWTTFYFFVKVLWHFYVGFIYLKGKV